jgi:uncharacterized protein (DUF433 family)
MIELTLDQVRALAQAGDSLTVLDPTTKRVYALVPAEHVHSGVGSCGDGGVGVGPSSDHTRLPLETPVEPWKYLVARRHPWRKQLSIKGRKMTVRQLLSTVIPNRFTEEQAAADLDLPVEAIREALAYAKENAALLEYETAYERLRLEQGGKRLGPHSVSR